VFRSTSEDRVLGTVSLTARKWLPVGGHRYWLFETVGHTNYCVPRPRLWFHYGMHIRAMRNNRTPYNFKLAPRELLRLFVFYICPRPVVLVTVACGDALNVFPMDLVGPTDSGFFSLALRSTSPAVELMRASRRLALASPPFEYKDQVYALGKHHRVQTIDPATLPFETDLSPTFGLPIMAAALRVREVEIHQVHVVGSHTVFLTSVVSDESRSQRLQLFHTCGFYQYYLERHGRTAPEPLVDRPTRHARSGNQPDASAPSSA
jgi:flavin reductase (DIM6/NTAB) family NADH-FMN oxidoreductase RutF